MKSVQKEKNKNSVPSGRCLH